MTVLSPIPRATWALPASLIAVYATGLAGPFVLDDHVNLAPIWRWWAGNSELSQVFANPSGPFGRPLAMLSFAANAAIGGQSSFGFKLVNLALHVVNSALVFAILRRLLPERGIAIVLLATAAWALHPQHVSTVLYVVQRMALLGALAQFAAVWIYLEARAAWSNDPSRARILLFAAFPAVVLVGALGKETALLAPLLCAAIEYGLLRTAPLPRQVRIFFTLSVALPLLATMAVLLAMPETVLRGYAHREFDLAGRLMTQGRALFDYAAHWFYPSIDRLSLYRDGFPLSTGWWTPPTTALSVAGLAALLAAALTLRSRCEPLAAGLLWFLAAHALESSAYPLELYFEHRNYVASFGLVLMVLGLARMSPRPTPAVARIAAFTLLSLLSAITMLRAWHWGDLDRLLASESPPAGELSRRLQVDRAIRGFERSDPAQMQAALARLADGNAGDRAAAALWRVVFACEREHRIDASAIEAVFAHVPVPVTHSHVSWLVLAVDRSLRDPGCIGFETPRARALVDAYRTAARDNHEALSRLDAIAQRLTSEKLEP